MQKMISHTSLPTPLPSREPHRKETICAIATATGGAIGIVRVSGPDALPIADALFKPKGSRALPLRERKANTVAFGTIVSPAGETIDEVLATVFRAPHSYTGEDSVELSCHGSSYILQCVVELLVDAGCRLAAPGEYTQRAFLNGKMDLSQAEAVADLIASQTAASHRLALRQMRGAFSTELSALRERLLHLTSLMELELDFSDHEELEFASRPELDGVAAQVEAKVERLAASFRLGNAIKRGVPVAIVGETNAGKSTLLNRLVGEERAIVSDVRGTTRDVIEDTVNIGGVNFRFIDTAGLRDTTDEIEAIGVCRAYRKVEEAEAVILLLDATDAEAQYKELAPKVLPLAEGKPIITVVNKSDLASPTLTLPDTPYHIYISAKQGDGIEKLKATLREALHLDTLSPEDVIVSNARHHEALTRALQAIRRVRQGLASATPTDLVAEDLRDTLAHLASITGGEIVTDEVLGNIFSHFCVGK